MKYIDKKLTVEKISIENIAKRFNTPAYCYSYNQLSENIKNFKNNFKSFSPLICFAVKSNNNLNLLKEIKKFGLGADVVSVGELMIAIKAGINTKKIVFSGVGKTSDEINYAIDNFIIISDPENLLKITVLLIGLLFCEGFIQFFYIYLSTWIGQNVILDLRKKIFRHIMSLKMKFFDKTPIGTLVTRAVSDIETIADIFSQGLLVIIAELLKLVIVLVFMFYTDWRLSIIALLTIPVLLVATAWFKRNIKASFQDVRDKVSSINSFVQEHIVGMNIVQIFNREEAEFDKFKKINADHRDAHLRSIFYYAVFFPVVEVLSAVSIGLVVWYGGEGILSGKDITIGEIIAFILFIHMMFRPIRQLADRFNVLQMGIVGSERVFKIIDTDEKIKDEGKTEVSDLSGEISFENVWFRYKEDQWILKDLSFNVNSGKFLALVGHTGAGKSSIIRILNRFYEIEKGKIKIDNISIDDLTLNSLRNNIALVQQEVFLFSDSILIHSSSSNILISMLSLSIILNMDVGSLSKVFF